MRRRRLTPGHREFSEYGAIKNPNFGKPVTIRGILAERKQRESSKSVQDRGVAGQREGDKKK